MTPATHDLLNRKSKNSLAIIIFKKNPKIKYKFMTEFSRGFVKKGWMNDVINERMKIRGDYKGSLEIIKRNAFDLLGVLCK